MTVPPGMEQVSLAINPGTPVFCAPAAPDGGCAFVVRFATSGFPATAVFRVAVRTLNPTGPWAIGTALISGGAPTSSFDAPVAVSGGPSTPAAGPVAAQAAVLVFASGADSVPAAVSELTDSGAEAAFVTPPFTLQPD